MGRYTGSVHESALICDECRTKNAPERSDGFDAECWRCGELLVGDAKPEVGDVVEVDVVDLDSNGHSIGKMENGFVLFLDCEVAGVEAKVEVTEVAGSHGRAILIE